LHTILHRTDLIIFPLTLQTITTAPMMSIWGKGDISQGSPHPWLRSVIPQGNNWSQPWVGGPHHVWYLHCSLATDWPYCFRFPNFPRIMEWWGSKCPLWVHKLAKIVFLPLKFFRGHICTPTGQSILEHTTSCGTLSQKMLPGCRTPVDRIRKKQLKYNTSSATVINKWWHICICSMTLMWAINKWMQKRDKTTAEINTITSHNVAI